MFNSPTPVAIVRMVAAAAMAAADYGNNLIQAPHSAIASPYIEGLGVACNRVSNPVNGGRKRFKMNARVQGNRKTLPR
jgi:hypothetical protein